ncbi:MAG: class I SAM-dependent methyltransferase [Actinomycetota bacterium]
MLDQPDSHLDPEIASTYDDEHADRDVDDVVAVLSRLADGGRAVEFAIGTGRIAVPLAASGVAVCGMDISEPMLAELRAKPGAAGIDAVVGDMTTTVMGDDVSLVYLVFNTIMNLRTQAAQVACFENAARHLRPGGRFVVEVIVPGLRRLPPGQTARPFDVSEHHLGFDEYLDFDAQILVSHHVTTLPDGSTRRTSSPFRYVWPSELDLMARLAGMTLESRHADWDASPFTGDSGAHVSVYVKD